MRPHYYSVNEFIKDTYGVKMYKLALNAGLSCPNRDGLIDTRGCIFCSKGGSGDFTYASDDILTQIEKSKALILPKYKGSDYIAYFQAFTNTYGSIEYLEGIYTKVINHPDIKILSIATRPDCLSDDILLLLSKLNQQKPVWIELGLQTTNDESVKYIRRGYNNEIFADAVSRIRKFNAASHIIAHMIIGLPNETISDMSATANFIIQNKIDGIKLQLLHILSDTDLATDYHNQSFKILSLDEYIDIIEKLLQILPPDIVIHRITGDGPKNLLIAPKWSADKKNVINTLNKRLKMDNIIQGTYFRKD